MCMGEPIGVGTFPCLLEPELLSLSPWEQRKLAGNAIETTFYSHVLLYGLSKLELIWDGSTPLDEDIGLQSPGVVELIELDSD